MRTTDLENELIAKLDQAASHLLFLSNVSRVLTGALTETDCFDRLLKLVVPRIADWATLNIIVDGNEVRRVGLIHADPNKQNDLETLAKQFQSSTGDAAGPGVALKSGKSELFSPLTHEQIMGTIRDPEVVENLKKFGIVSAISVPLKAHRKVIGALWLATSDSGRVLTDDDFKLVQEIAERAACAAYHMLRYEQTNETLERLQIEMVTREQYFANTRHDVLTALTAAMLTAQLIESKSGGMDELARRNVEVLRRITEIIRSSGPSVPLQDAITPQGHATMSAKTAFNE